MQVKDKIVTLEELKAGLDKKVDTSDVVNNLTSTATDKPGSANMLKTLNDKFGGVQIVLVETLVSLPDGTSYATTTTVDLSSYVPSGKTIRAISSMFISDYAIPYVENGNVMTYVARVVQGNKISIINRTTEWTGYTMHLVLFCA